jgi:hypothetical protein
VTPAAAAREVLDRGYALCRGRGVATWDPFDIKGSRLALWTFAGPGRVPVRKALYAADLLAPKLARRLLGLRPTPSDGGVAHWLQAVLAYARLTGSEPEGAGELAGWLEAAARPGPQGHGWGLPFDWQAFVVVPAGTPIGHTTMSVLNALLDAREAGVEVADATIQGGLDFLVRGLNLTERPSGTAALSYTALDRSQVVNTNAEIAALLLRAGRPGDRALAERLLGFVAEAQNEDGSWFYSAPDAGEGRQVVDNYHTAMILLALGQAVLELPSLAASLERGWAFHLANHFDADGRPRMRPHTPWPVDAYSAGESLLALVNAAGSEHLEPRLREECRRMAGLLVTYIVRNLAYPDGGFVYRVWRWKRMRLDSLRWADALMCEALAEYCRAGG